MIGRPNDGQARRLKIAILLDMHLYEEALREFDDLLDRDEHDAELRQVRALVLVVLNRFHDALRSIDTSMEVRGQCGGVTQGVKKGTESGRMRHLRMPMAVVRMGVGKA